MDLKRRAAELAAGLRRRDKNPPSGFYKPGMRIRTVDGREFTVERVREINVDVGRFFMLAGRDAAGCRVRCNDSHVAGWL